MILSKLFQKTEEQQDPEALARKEKEHKEIKALQKEAIKKSLMRQVTPFGTIYYY